MLSRQIANLLRYNKVFTAAERTNANGVVKFRSLGTTSILKDTFNVEDEEEFQTKVIESEEPVVVDFSAKWCGPCKLLTPRLDAAIAGTEGKVHLAIVDIDELSDLALDHGVQAVPAVMAFKDGEIVDKFVGLLDEDKLDAFVNKLY